MSVPSKYGKRGIGKALVQSIESQLADIAQKELDALLASDATICYVALDVNMEMGVINQRKDLFPWYEGQGYVVIGEIKPNDEELLRICLDECDICCILMRKHITMS